MSISYPLDQVYLIEPLVKVLDNTFYDTCSIYNNVLHDEEHLRDITLNTDTAKQVYRTIDNKYLRFDHTQALLRPHKYMLEHVSHRNFGPIFRKGPRSGSRWRQFFQYDVDYLYENHNLRPLMKWIKLFSSDMSTRVNDLQLLMEHLNIQRELVSEDTIKDLDLASINLDEYQRKFYNRYPDLKILSDFITVDVSLVRGWSYYQSLVFESYYRNSTYAVCGGGIYIANRCEYLGIGIGINRLIKCLIEYNTYDHYVPKTKLVLVYNKSKLIPHALLDALECNSVPYVLKSARKNLYQDSEKLGKILSKAHKVITRIVITGPSQIQSNQYNYKSRTRTYNNLNPEDLVSILKSHE
jgi:histidyl-tRNA synthetase